jgi:hypothetical protein
MLERDVLKDIGITSVGKQLEILKLIKELFGGYSGYN